ncbi:MAG: tetratricopeptide repeat protein [Proteobacteria bacterium]|nr:tetratricopeptide repeat protein [Pseudomonadota bacterium]
MRIKPLFHFVLATSLFITPAVAFGQGLAGAYLSANHANAKNDYIAAADFYSKALAQDPDDAFMLQNALLAYVAIGEMDDAIKLAEEITKLEFASQLSDLTILASHVRDQDFATALELLATAKDRLSPLLHDLLKGWALVGSGDMSAATEHFDSMTKPDALRVFGQYHKALAVAMAGDFELADKIMQGDDGNALHINRGSLIAHVQILSQLEKFDEAAAILEKSAAGTSDQQIRDLFEKMRSKQSAPFDFIKSANDGISETFLTMASVLSGEEDERFSLIYARMAEFLGPNNIQSLLLLANTLRSQKQYDLATQVLAKVPVDHPMYLNAELSRADTLVEADKPQAAIAVLQRLAGSNPKVARVHMIQGDVYSGEKQFREANKAYTVAISLLEQEKASQWFLYYARGVSFERLDEWDKAEADFRKALELSPNQPSTLNYLGYSLVEKRIKLEEAQELIERAVKWRPNDGFITDSLGWLLYRIGKFEEAVQPMERAVELMPTDPIINDHLGDVYWKTGRVREAQFQWRRALSFDPEEKDAKRIRRKLEVGLDQVLTAEDAASSNAN